jgi:hypothetical protein
MSSRSQHAPQLLTGLLRCGVCQRAAIVRWGGAAHRPYGYSCSSFINGQTCAAPRRNYHNAKQLESAVLAELQRFSDAARVEALTPPPPEQDHTVELRRLRHDLDDLESSFRRSFDLFMRGVLTDEAQFKAGNQALTDRRAAIEQRIQQLTQAAGADREHKRQLTVVSKRADELLQSPDAPMALRKAILADLIERIEVYPDQRIIVTWRI